MSIASSDSQEDADVDILSSLFAEQANISLFKVTDGLFENCQYLVKQIGNPLIYYNVKIGSSNLNALLDCGSTRTWMDINTAKKHGFRLVEIEPFKVELADGSEVECKYKVEKLTLKFKSFRHDTELYVMDFKGAHDIILGRDFLYRRNPIIDWRTGEMTLRRKTSKVSNKGDKNFVISSTGWLAKNSDE